MNSLRTTFVVNPRSAGGRTGRSWPERERIMRELFPEAEVQFTKGPGDASLIAAQAVARGQELVVAVGGDGSINEVLNGLMAEGGAGAGVRAGPGDGPGSRAGAALGILPSGTGCDLIRTLGIPSEFSAALRVLQEGSLRYFDVGLVSAADSETPARYFLNAATVGIGAEIAAKVNGRRKRLGATPTFLWTTLVTLLRYRNATVRLLQEGCEPEIRRIKAVTINNARYFGSGMCIAPEAQPDDGELDLVVVGDLGRFEAMRRLGETYSGRRIEHPDIDYRRCTSITIEATDQREILVEMDGEIWGPLPARFEIKPAAVKIVVPD
jgi:YegS/Rv2252/BmrU family lipid kinase